MRQSNFVIVMGLLGPLALIAGCAGGPTSTSNHSATPVATGAKAPETKQVTLSVSGMT